MFASLVAAAISLGANLDVDPDVLWIEGEAFYAQAGSVGPDRPPFASRGRCLGSGWGGHKGHFVVYRLRLAAARENVSLHFRYARLPQSESLFDLFCDGKAVARRLAFKPTGGWGHLRDDEWRTLAVPLGRLDAGWHDLKLVSLAERNNTNLDGLFLAGPDFKPPAARKAIERLPRPVTSRKPDPFSPECRAEGMKFEEVSGRQGDWYYPAEEPAQRASLKIPLLVQIAGQQVTLTRPEAGKHRPVSVGEESDGWRVVETLDQPEPLVVLEREFDRWGLIVYVGRNGVRAEIRKAVGRLASIAPPRPLYPPDYFKRLRAAKEDLLGKRVLASGGDPGYEDLAGLLAPLHTYTFLGSPESPKKYVVQPDGSISLLPERWGGAKALETTVFDPRKLLGNEAETDATAVAKRGLLGGYLPAVNYGFYRGEPVAKERDRDATVGRIANPSHKADCQSALRGDASAAARRALGWELCAFMEPGKSSTVFARIRRTDGKTRYYRLAPLEELTDGKPFYAALLRLDHAWRDFFAGGMQFEVADRRTTDVARASVVRALCGCVGPHPKYGMGGYWARQHDTFPPTTLSLCTCLADWGFDVELKRRLGYYLDRFVKPDGTLAYYGPAVAEYGELLDLAATTVRRTGDLAWFDQHRAAVERVVGHVLKLRSQSTQSQSPDAISYGLLFGSPEADTRKDTDYYFSGSAWCWRGLLEIGNLYAELGGQRNDDKLADRSRELIAECEGLRADILKAVERSIVPSKPHAFVPPIAGFDKPFAAMTQDRLASYTNYRYWPEALSAGCLGAENERRILDYRLHHGGELLGMTRFAGHLDDWPFYHQAYALAAHDRVDRFLLAYFAHVAHHQTPGTFTAYEQVPIDGFCFRREWADYCVPAQLTAPLMTRWMLVFEERDADVLWLCRAVPRRWLEKPLSVGVPTRWGPLSLHLKPSDDLRQVHARITLAGQHRPLVMLRLRHPRKLRIAGCEVTGGRCEKIDAGAELVHLRPEAGIMSVTLSFGPKAVSPKTTEP